MKAKWIILVGVLLVGTVSMFACAPRVVRQGDTVQVDYSLKLDDGSVYYTSEGRDPHRYTLGEQVLIPGVENAVMGMVPGELKAVRLPYQEAYGPYRPELVTIINRDELPDDQEFVVGQRMQTRGTDGKAHVLVITDVTDTEVTFDANSPLAGMDLTYEIELVSIVTDQPTSRSYLRSELVWFILGLVILFIVVITYLYLRRQNKLQ